MRYSTRLRDAIDGRLVLPRLLRAIRQGLRERSLRGEPLAIVRRKADPRSELLAAALYLERPQELREADSDLTQRLTVAAAVSACNFEPRPHSELQAVTLVEGAA